MNLKQMEYFVAIVSGTAWPHWFLQLMHQTASREFIPPLNIASNRSTGNRLFLKTVCALGDAAGAD